MVLVPIDVAAIQIMLQEYGCKTLAGEVLQNILREKKVERKGKSSSGQLQPKDDQGDTNIDPQVQPKDDQTDNMIMINPQVQPKDDQANQKVCLCGEYISSSKDDVSHLYHTNEDFKKSYFKSNDAKIKALIKLLDLDVEDIEKETAFWDNIQICEICEIKMIAMCTMREAAERLVLKTKQLSARFRKALILRGTETKVQGERVDYELVDYLIGKDLRSRKRKANSGSETTVDHEGNGINKKQIDVALKVLARVNVGDSPRYIFKNPRILSPREMSSVSDPTLGKELGSTWDYGEDVFKPEYLLKGAYICEEVGLEPNEKAPHCIIKDFDPNQNPCLSRFSCEGHRHVMRRVCPLDPKRPSYSEYYYMETIYTKTATEKNPHDLMDVAVQKVDSNSVALQPASKDIEITAMQPAVKDLDENVENGEEEKVIPTSSVAENAGIVMQDEALGLGKAGTGDHGQQQSGQRAPKVPCPKCGKRVHSEFMDNHMKRHSKKHAEKVVSAKRINDKKQKQEVLGLETARKGGHGQQQDGQRAAKVMKCLKWYVCSKCGKSFPKKVKCNRHICSEHAEDCFQCSHYGCEKVFVTRRALYKHTKNPHLKKPVPSQSEKNTQRGTGKKQHKKKSKNAKKGIRGEFH